MKKLAQFIVLFQAFLILCGCGEFLLVLSINGEHHNPVSTTVSTAEHTELNAVTDYTSSFDHGTITNNSKSHAHVIYTVLGEEKVEETSAFDKFLKTSRYIILLFGAHGGDISLAKLLPEPTFHNPFAAASLKKWQPVLQVFRL